MLETIEEDEEQKKIKTQKLKLALERKAEMTKRQNKLKAMMRNKPVNFGELERKQEEEDKQQKAKNLFQKATKKIIENNKEERKEQSP